jgi:hypothetical protein
VPELKPLHKLHDVLVSRAENGYQGHTTREVVVVCGHGHGHGHAYLR